MPNNTEYHLGLLGWQLGHSKSPPMHNAALKAAGFNGSYELYSLSPEDENGIPNLLAGFREGKLQGLNVTIPHKQRVIPYLEQLSPAARNIGAVNTILLKEGKLWGENTDAPGFLADLARQRGESTPGAALILGAGGAARAAGYALLTAGWQVCFAARRIAQAEEVCQALHSTSKTACRAIPLTAAALSQETPQLIVNSTPLGMFPHTEGNPWLAEIPLPDACFIYDMVYNPPQTQLIQQATATGLSAANGMGMLVEQARLAFEHWTGVLPAYQIMADAYQNHD